MAAQMWGIHNDKLPAQILVDQGFVSIGWDEIGDLRQLGDDQMAMRAAVERAYPMKKPGSHPVSAGVLRRFAFKAQVGDYVVAPDRKARTLNFGRLAGPYEFHPELSTHRHRRRVTWLVTGVPRAEFTQPALYEVGSAVTMFSVSKHIEEFLGRIDGRVSASTEPSAAEDRRDAEAVVRAVEEEPSAAKLEQYTQDLVLKALAEDLSPEEEVVPGLVDFEVAVPRLRPTWW